MGHRNQDKNIFKKEEMANWLPKDIKKSDKIQAEVWLLWQERDCKWPYKNLFSRMVEIKAQLK